MTTGPVSPDEGWTIHVRASHPDPLCGYLPIHGAGSACGARAVYAIDVRPFHPHDPQIVAFTCAEHAPNARQFDGVDAIYTYPPPARFSA